jgi:hypothetical protein
LEKKSVGTDYNLNSVQFIDENLGIAVGSGGLIFRTSNGGINWQLIPSGTYSSLYSVSFSDQYNGWIVGSNGIILHSNNSGLNWQFQSSPTKYGFHSVHFLNRYKGWIAGVVGTILKTTNGGFTYIENNSNQYETDNFLLRQNYPNPFNSLPKISFSVNKLALVKIKICDLLGEEIAYLMNEWLKSGEYEIELNASRYNLSSGVYFYIMQIDERIMVKKMVYIK